MKLLKSLSGHIALLLPFGVATLVSLLAVGAILRLDRMRTEQSDQSERAWVRSNMEVLRSRLEKEIADPLLRTRAVSAQIVAHGDISPEEFSKIVRVLIEDDKKVIDMVASRGTVIRMVYPRQNNIAVLGQDYRESAEQWPGVEEAIHSRRALLFAPIHLLQGGQGIIVREPVFLPANAHHGETFFGLVSIVLDIPKVFSDAGFDEKALPIDLAVFTTAGSQKGPDLLFGDQQLVRKNPVVIDISIPYGTWHMAAVPKQGWHSSEAIVSLSRILNIGVFVLLLVINYGTAFFIFERRRSERKINQLAFYDHLTGLPNRTMLVSRYETASVREYSAHSFGALLFVDLDDFKTLNDTLGHSMGDLLLKHVADRLQHCIRSEDTVSRLGGDEFLVMTRLVAEDMEQATAEARNLSERIHNALGLQYFLESASYHCTSSIGVTIFSGEHADFNDILRQADLAMYRAKALGRNLVSFFNPDMESNARERATLVEDLRDAISNSEFLLHYQVQVDGESNPIGTECLVRWHHPIRGLVLPGEFIPAAEETGLILPIGIIVLRQACQTLAEWTKLPRMQRLSMAVNVSIRQFRHHDFVDAVTRILNETGADPRLLRLELTESVLVDDLKGTAQKMSTLKDIGVGFSLDDFGTGYSSLAYLKRLPLDHLKIDQAFVRDALNDPSDAALIRTVIALGQNMGLEVIAEGVETAAQRDFLLSAGCFRFQGYLFGRPLPKDAFIRYLEHNLA